MDREAWYSVTPEPIAKYLATRVSDVAKGAQYNNGDDTDMAEQRPCANVMDPFGGVGGNMIQFAIECGFCLGVDCDPAKVAFMRNNAKVYGLSEGRDFQLLQADFLSLPDPEEGFINFPEEN
jgi:trimethylguanosine synthase